MRNFSKSKLLALRQCPKRLWLEINQPELREDSAATQASFQVGHQVGDIARRIYDPDGLGALIDVQREGFNAAFARSKALLQTDLPIFEAGFCAAGALAFADVLLPLQADGKQGWRMVEVKSSTSVKDDHRDDCAIQAFVARAAGVPLHGIALARSAASPAPVVFLTGNSPVPARHLPVQSAQVGSTRSIWKPSIQTQPESVWPPLRMNCSATASLKPTPRCACGRCLLAALI